MACFTPSQGATLRRTLRMNFYVFWVGVQSHPRQAREGLVQRLTIRTRQDEVKVGHSDVVGPDLDLLHGGLSSRGAFERHLRSGKSTPWSPDHPREPR